MKQTIIAMMATLVFAICIPNNTMAKKIMYKHHQYKGDVNKEYIPQGKGTIDIAGLVIKGMFNGTTISGASIENDWYRYDGDIVYNESKRVTLKAGGRITKYYYENLRPRNDYGKEVVYFGDLKNHKVIIETISEDIEMSNDDFLNMTVGVPLYLEMKDVPLELNPPKIKKEVSVSLEKYILNHGGFTRDIFLYIINDGYIRYMISKEFPYGIWVYDYKDDEGRVWEYSEKEKTYKVTYPDGSYASNSTKGNIVRQ